MNTTAHEIAKQIRQEFFVYRNGLLADNLREAGDNHRMIFGLTLTQIQDIAKSIEPNEDVALELWQSKETREARLIAPMLYPMEKFTEDMALQWTSQIENTEVADNMCHKLLRRTPFASSLCCKLAAGNDLERYTAMRLAINLIAIGKNVEITKMQELAQSEINSANKVNISVAKRLIEDLSEIL